MPIPTLQRGEKGKWKIMDVHDGTALSTTLLLELGLLSTQFNDTMLWQSL